MTDLITGREERLMIIALLLLIITKSESGAVVPAALGLLTVLVALTSIALNYHRHTATPTEVPR